MGTPLNNSVIKAFDILRLFTPHANEITATGAARKLGMTTATAHRLLLTLADVGALRRGDKGRFQLGMLLADLGDRVAHDAALSQAAQPHIDALVREFNESVVLAVLDGDEAIVAAAAEPERSLRIGVPVGKRMPLHASAVGKVLLAHQPPQRIEALLVRTDLRRLTAQCVVEAAQLREQCQLVRAHGYAVDYEEMEDGVQGVAVPLFGGHGALKGALSMCMPSGRADRERQSRILQQLQQHAQAIAQRVGVESRVLAGKAAPRGPFPHLKRVGNLIFVSGTSARRPDNSFEGAFIDADGRAHLDISAQTRATIGNISDMLESVGASLANVIDLEAFLVDISNYQAFNEVYAEYFGEEGPARATVAACALPHPHQLLMIKAVALAPGTLLS